VGSNYSYSLIVDSKEVDFLLRELASYLSEIDARRLTDALPWKPAVEREVVWGSGKAVRTREGINKLGIWQQFSFFLPPDASLEKYLRPIYSWNLGEPNSQRRGEKLRTGLFKYKIRIDRVSIHLWVGSGSALLVASAHDSTMSDLFNQSSSIRRSWIELAERVSAKALFFDAEQEYDWLLLYPQVRIVVKPWDYNFYSEDLQILRVDEYCQEALHVARLNG
jgi:hypothetical protein